MGTSEYGNISWVFYVFGAYACVAISLLLFAITSRQKYCKAQEALKEEGFSADKDF
ncbi:MAG: hypothetical protein RI953_2780 [Pseudomonadota bacterium]|jgi:choline-glycine betaine transporter